MNIAYLILGGNIGDVAKSLVRTRKSINEKAGRVIQASDVFITAAWGNKDQPDFYNQALKIETSLRPSELLKRLLNIEATEGRIRDENKKWAERTMDIDILFYNDEIINELHLHIPHAHLAERKFVLAPLAQIAGEYLHPVLKKSINRLLEDCPDNSDIRIIESIQ